MHIWAMRGLLSRFARKRFGTPHEASALVTASGARQRRDGRSERSLTAHEPCAEALRIDFTHLRW